MSETVKLAAMVVRHGGESWSDAVREAFVEQALRARDEYDDRKSELERLRAELDALRKAAAAPDYALVSLADVTADLRVERGDRNAENQRWCVGVSALRAYALQQARKLRVLRSMTQQKQGEAYQDIADRLRALEVELGSQP